MKRTADSALDQDFEYVGEIVKSYVDEKTGKRYIIGAASGLEEDKDGERVSKRAITGMVNAVGAGAVKLTGGTHDQNWLTEIGDAIDAHIDPKTDQFMVKTELPPEGTDPIADKAWKETHKRKMGFSVGGKLRSAYFELTELGKKRKVLDSIDLRHLCLTDKPAYQHSFAEAVAKAFNGDPAEGEFTLEVEKDTTSGSWAPGGGGNSGQDSNTGGQRNAGTKKPGSKGPNVQDDRKSDNQDDDDEKDLEPASRHLSCPNCGHEFAADIPVDMTPEERSKREEQDREKQQGGSTTSKSEEAKMDETAVEKRIKALEDLVAKQAADAERANAETVAKGKISDDVLKVATEEGIDPGVLKIVALATGDHEERIEKTRKELGEGFEILGKTIMEIRNAVGELPTGRKSVARILPKSGHGIGNANVEEELAKAESPIEALKIMNRETYGIQ
jgi:hypothetical protein